MKHEPRLPEDLRLYAIGDIHGRHDLLQQILDKIRIDAQSCAQNVRLVFLGDYIDRGLHSREVIEILARLPEKTALPPVFIQGNHDMMLRDIVADLDTDSIGSWLHYGGIETCRNYGVIPPAELSQAKIFEFIMRLQDAIPPSHHDFLNRMQTHAVFGDYFFCHAGVRPKVPLENQTAHDMAWIRDDFISCTKPFDKIIVHGHTISTEPEVTPVRIGIDTGAYATGRLTALGLEGSRQWFLST